MKWLAALLLSVGLVVADDASQAPTPRTPLTDSEHEQFLKSLVLFLDAKAQRLEAMMNDRLGVAVQRAAEDALVGHQRLLAEMQRKHGAQDCQWTINREWACPKERGK